jgi:hypothetical protein
MGQRDRMPVSVRGASCVGAALTVLIGGITLAADTTPGDTPAPEVHYRDGRLSASIRGVPLDDVLRAVAAETGVRFEGTPLDERDVFKRFDDVPLAEAFRRLIGRQNFTLVYGADGRPSRVELMGVPAPVVARGPRTPPPPPFRVVLAQQPPVAVSERLAKALGALHGPLPLVRVLQALRLDDATVRDEAVDTFLRVLQSTPALLSSFTALDDRTTAKLARSWGGVHAADALSLMSTRTHNSSVRAIATKGLALVRLDQASAQRK